MTKFKNIKRSVLNYTETPVPKAKMAPKELKKVAEKKLISEAPSVTKVHTKSTSNEVKTTKSNPSRIGKSVLVLSFFVIVQVALLVSLIYLSPVLLR